jgi:hypothetical protein
VESAFRVEPHRFPFPPAAFDSELSFCKKAFTGLIFLVIGSPHEFFPLKTSAKSLSSSEPSASEP